VIAPALVIVALATAAQTTTPAANTTTAAESPWTLREQLQIPAMTTEDVVWNSPKPVLVIPAGRTAS
jgi:hypothetical protein